MGLTFQTEVTLPFPPEQVAATFSRYLSDQKRDPSDGLIQGELEISQWFLIAPINYPVNVELKIGEHSSGEAYVLLRGESDGPPRGLDRGNPAEKGIEQLLEAVEQDLADQAARAAEQEYKEEVEFGW